MLSISDVLSGNGGSSSLTGEWLGVASGVVVGVTLGVALGVVRGVVRGVDNGVSGTPFCLLMAISA